MGKYTSRKNETSMFTSPKSDDEKPEQPTAAAPTEFTVPEGYRLVRESRTARLQILVRPGIHAKLKSIAAEEQTSVNEIVNGLIEEFVANREEK